MRHAHPLPAFTAVLVLFCFGGVSGQDRRDTPKSAIPPGWATLGLTDAQKVEVLKINAEYREKFDKLEEEIKKLKAEQVKKRVAVLTDEQRKKLREQAGEPEPPAKEKPPTKP
jgi:hypothetical protein